MQDFTRKVNPPDVTPRAVNPWTDRIKVVSVHPTAQTGPIRAFVTITIGEALEIRGCKVIQQVGQRAWVSLPDRKNEEGTGYFPIVKALDDRLKTAITAAVLEAWRNGGEA
jgi:DNA-binding cell septation regulator SpoVG